MSIFRHTFPKPNLSDNWVCPICDQATEKPVVLMPIKGTEEGGIVRCKQIHADCLQSGVSALLNQGR